MMFIANSTLAARNPLCPPKHVGSRRYRVALFVFSKCLVPGFRIGWVAEEAMPDKSAFAVNEQYYPPVPHAIGVSGLSSTRR